MKTCQRGPMKLPTLTTIPFLLQPLLAPARRYHQEDTCNLLTINDFWRIEHPFTNECKTPASDFAHVDFTAIWPPDAAQIILQTSLDDNWPQLRRGANFIEQTALYFAQSLFQPPSPKPRLKHGPIVAAEDSEAHII